MSTHQTLKGSFAGGWLLAAGCLLVTLSTPGLRADTIVSASIDANGTLNSSIGYTEYTGGNVVWARSTAHTTAPGNVGVASRFGYGTSPAGSGFKFSPTLPTAGGAYGLYLAHEGRSIWNISPDLTVDVTAESGCTGMNGSSTIAGATGAFNSAACDCDDSWVFVANLMLNSGVTVPTIRFTYHSGNLADTSHRWNSDNYKFVYLGIPVRIATQPPASATVLRGNLVLLRVTATGTSPSYAWKRDGTPIADAAGHYSGSATASLTITGQDADNGHVYSCTVANSVNSVTSTGCTLTVIAPPTIDRVTVNLLDYTAGGTYSASMGDTVALNITAHASHPFSYQWKLNGVNAPADGPTADGAVISGTTSNVMTVSAINANESGIYTCVLSNQDGMVSSAAINVPVTVCPAINAQPADQVVGAGASANFTVQASGSDLSYQWSRDGADLHDGGRVAGATSSALTLANAGDVDQGLYRCVVSNSCGGLSTAGASLTVIDPAAGATASPALQQVASGGTASFSVAVTGGTAPFAYQWLKGGLVISGATASTYSFTVAGPGDGGIYSCVVSNLGGSVTSSAARLLAPFTWADSFEGYSPGALDSNAGVNPSSWWFGHLANLSVINTEYATPHNQNGGSNTKMVRSQYGALGPGFNAPDKDLCYLNAGYRFNGGNVIYGDCAFEWWFYDLYGASGRNTDYHDEAALTYYSGLPTNADGSDNPTGLGQRLVIGACSANGALDATRYQVAMRGLSDGVAWNGDPHGLNNLKYFNTGLSRTIGWHHARIVVGRPDPTTHVATVQYFIDDMNKPQVTKTLPAGYVGFNALEITTSFSASTSGNTAMGYFDDAGFQMGSEPWIVQQPASFGVTAGGPATMTVVATGTGYQWKKDGVALSGATGSSYSIPAAGLGDAGSYTCTVTGAGGNLESAAGVLSVVGGTFGAGTGLQGQYYSDPALTTLSATRLDAAVNFDGGSGNPFPGVSVGPGNFSARWSGYVQPAFTETYTFYTASDDGVRLWVNGNLLIDKWVGQPPTEWSGGIALAAGKFYPIQLEYYQGAGGDMCNLKWSSPHTAKDLVPTQALYLYPPYPVIVSQPQDQEVGPGTTVTFSVVATGNAPMWYQWLRGGAVMAGVTGTSYTLTNAQPQDAAGAVFSVLITNGFGSVTSSTATLIVDGPPYFVLWPQSQTALKGSPVSFSALVSGTPPFAYQWSFNGRDISGATDSSYALAGAQFSDQGIYAVEVYNGWGDVQSPYALLNVINGAVPVIVAPPQSQSVKTGADVVFSVTATGSPAPAYQWKFNGASITGATTNRYVLLGVQGANAGSYSVVVSNLAGSVTTNASLSVNPIAPARITAINRLSHGQIQLTIEAEAGHSYGIESSTDLSNWSQLGTQSNATGAFQFLDSDTNQCQRFYRTRRLSQPTE